VAIVVGTLIAVYFGGYFYLRATSESLFGIRHFGLNKSEISEILNPLVTPDTPQHAEIEQIIRRQRFYNTIYRPMVWLDEKITGERYNPIPLDD